MASKPQLFRKDARLGNQPSNSAKRRGHVLLAIVYRLNTAASAEFRHVLACGVQALKGGGALTFPLVLF